MSFSESLLKDKPAKPTSLWMEYVKVQRLEVLEENPQLRGNGNFDHARISKNQLSIVKLSKMYP